MKKYEFMSNLKIGDKFKFHTNNKVHTVYGCDHDNKSIDIGYRNPFDASRQIAKYEYTLTEQVILIPPQR